MKKIISFVAVALIIGSIACNSSSRVNKESINSGLAASIDNNNWVFSASQALPQSGSPQYLNHPYTVHSSKGSVVVTLPYFGRAEATADLLSGKSPLNFTSTDFTRTVKPSRSGKWNVTIKPNDYREVRSMDFIFYDDGKATLNVNMNSRSPISFSGSIKASN